MKFMQFPLAKVSVAFCLGLVYAHFQPSSLVTSSVLFCSSFAFLIGFRFTFKKAKANSYLVLIVSFLLGLWITALHFEPNKSHHYLHITNDYSAYNIELILRERLKSSQKNNRYVAEIKRINQRESCGKVIVNLRKSKTSISFDNGTLIRVKGELYRNTTPPNPFQFDYNSYLKNQQIFAQIYTDYESIEPSPYPVKSLSQIGSKIRNRISNNLEKTHLQKDVLSIVMALLLGQQQDISKAILLDYQYAGAIHILSVSGLHVGFILLFVVRLLKPIPNHRKGLAVKLIITLLSLWAFGILAGLAPSVVRSVTMFSFVAIGLFLKRSVNMYHSLLVSIFLILLFRPSFLFDVGFQLSYLALFFILWLQPLLASIWTPKYRVITYFWEILTVSFAAQIGTLPTSLYYFHQFSGLFFITNLIVLLLLSVVLALTLLVVIIAGFGLVPSFLVQLLTYAIQLLNGMIGWVASFEDFVLKDLPMNTMLLLTSYGMVIAWIIFFKKITYRNSLLLATSILFFQASLIYIKYKTQTANEFIVFNEKKKTLLTKKLNQKITVFTNETKKSIDQNWSLQSYTVGNFSRLHTVEPLSNFYYFNRTKIMLIDSSGVYLSNSKPDVVILTQSPKINLIRMISECQPKIIVADASNYLSYKKLWKTTCEKEKIPFHDTTEKGFFRL